MRRNAVISLVLLALFCWVGLALAQQKQVVTKDGRKFIGEVTQTKDGYVVKTAIGDVRLKADEVSSIADVRGVADEYQRRLAATNAQDPDALYKLGDWAYKSGLLTEARQTLLKALQVNPNHESSRLLLRLVEKDIAVAATMPVATRATTTQAEFNPSMLLKEEGIYHIRLAELRSDENVQVEFRNKVIDRFIESMRGSSVSPFDQTDGDRQFKSWKSADQARLIMEYAGRDSYGIRDDVLVKNDPETIRQFRTKIWPVLAGSCASIACHGGARGQGSFKLFNVALSDDKVAYTNFYILTAWSKGGLKMIDRENPENSLLLQYGLPANLARFAHPGKGEAVFRKKDDANYRTIETWISKSLAYPLLSGYRIDYKLPMLDEPATTKPSPG